MRPKAPTVARLVGGTLGLIVILGSVIWGIKYFTQDTHPTFNPEVALRTSQEERKDGQDPQIKVSAIPGPKLVLLWTLGCRPCLSALMTLNGLVERIQEAGVTIVPILISHDPERRNIPWAQAVVFFSYMRGSHTNPTWAGLFPALTAYYDLKGQVFDQVAVNGAPTFLFVNKKGRIIEQVEGLPDWKSEEGQNALFKLLARLKGA